MRNFSIFLFGILFSFTAAASTLNGYLCNNCSFQQAEALAKVHGAPSLNCVAENPREPLTLDNQLCYSNSKKFTIFDPTDRVTYPFNVYHSNQGSKPKQMKPTTQPTNLSYKELQISQDFFTLMVLQEQTLQEYALFVNENIQLPMELTVSTQNTVKSTSSSTEDCTNDTSATVLQMVLNPVYKNRISNAVNHELRQQGSDDYRAGFEEIRFNQFGFDAKKDGLGISVGWQYIPKSKLAFKNIYEQGQQIRPDNEPYFPARAAYALSWNQKLDAITVEVDSSFTRVTETLTLADILESSSWNITLSACALKELDKHFMTSDATDDNSNDRGNGDGRGEFGSGDVHGDGSGNTGGSIPGIGSSAQLCKWHFYNKAGEIAVTVMGPCP